jgi:protein-S-isoprenylcysteine O-methyltransferase Ste14
MTASGFEFRWRFWIAIAIYGLGFSVPWDWALHLDSGGANAHVWGLLSALMAKAGLMSIGTAFHVLLVVAIACAVAGAWLRTWGTAYLGADAMSDSRMRGDGVVADGPYRYLRNPLYVGTWANAVALALLMPVSGAIFAVGGIVLSQFRLILREEDFLSAKLGEAYREYCARVPRIVPALRPRVARSGARAQWMRAALAEILMWGSAASFAVLGWRYDAQLLVQCMVVWLGVSMVVRGLRMKDGVAASSGVG